MCLYSANTRTSLALAALEDGDLDQAERLLAESGDLAATDGTGAMVLHQVRAELLRARGETSRVRSMTTRGRSA